MTCLQYIDSPEVEEVQRLIKEDLSAVHVSFKLFGEDEQRWVGEREGEWGGQMMAVMLQAVLAM